MAPISQPVSSRARSCEASEAFLPPAAAGDGVQVGLAVGGEHGQHVAALVRGNLHAADQRLGALAHGGAADGGDFDRFAGGGMLDQAIARLMAGQQGLQLAEYVHVGSGIAGVRNGRAETAIAARMIRPR